jgi:hypothetical protein
MRSQLTLFALGLAACTGSPSFQNPPPGEGMDAGASADAALGADGAAALDASSPTADAGPIIPPGCNGLSLSMGGELDLDIESVHLTGRITLNGAAAAPSGRIRFTSALGRSTEIEVAPTYDLWLASDTYDVRYIASQCDPSSSWPCNSGVVASSVHLSASGALDLDVHSVTVSGRVTVSGAPYPSAGGSLRFTLSNEASTDTGIPSGGSYSLMLLPGSYSVGYRAPSGCIAGSGVPCNGGTLKTNVDLSHAGALDLDVPMITVGGHVTLGHQPLPGLPSQRGGLHFSSAADPGGASVGLPSDGDASYSIALLPGSYGVEYVPSGCDSAGLPCNGGPLMSSISLSTSGALDLDIPSIAVSGRVTLNGGALPSGAPGNANLRFSMSGGAATTVPLDVMYSLSLMPGKYTVQFLAAGCDGSPLPCNGGPVVTDVALSASGALDLDIPAIMLSGRVTLVGQPLPNGADGHIRFSLSGGSAADIDPFGNGSYTVALFPGAYDVAFGSTGACDAATRLPCNSGTLRSSVGLMSSGALDLDIPSITVTGRVTLNHAAFGGQEQILFSLVNGGSVATDLNGGGYSLNLLPGSYVVSSSGLGCDTIAGLPCGGEFLRGCGN